MKNAIAIVWAFLLLFLLPMTTMYRMPPGSVNGTWYVCCAGCCGLVAYGIYCCRTAKLGGRLLHFAAKAVAAGILCCLLLTYHAFATETHYRMGGL